MYMVSYRGVFFLKLRPIHLGASADILSLDILVYLGFLKHDFVA